MKLMIDIDEKKYEEIKRIAEAQFELTDKTEAQIIANGTPISSDGDLISRSELIKEMCVKFYTEHYYASILNVIYKAPTVELFCAYLSDGEVRQPCVESPCKYERPQGEWIIVKDEKWGDNVKCPFCGKELAGTDLNFCCKCGADMRGKEE